jgi:hypothetical protein
MSVQNQNVVLFPSAARTATITSENLLNQYGREIDVVLDVTAVVTTPSLVLTIDYLDAASGKYVNLLTGAAVATVSTNRYRVHPNIANVTNLVAQAQLPRVFRIVVTAADDKSATYSVGYRIGIN